MISEKEVSNIPQFAQYLRERLGVPVRQKDLEVLGSHAKKFFDDFPYCTWETLCEVVMWGKRKKYRPGFPHEVFSWVRWANKEGAVDLSADEGDLSEKISEALNLEDDLTWRKRLLSAEGASDQKKVLEQWKKERKLLPSPTLEELRRRVSNAAIV